MTLSAGTLNVGFDQVVLCEPPVALSHTQNLTYVPASAVVCVERCVPVIGCAPILEIRGGCRYGVFGVHNVRDAVLVAVDPVLFPGRRQKLHRTHCSGTGGAHVLSMV